MCCLCNYIFPINFVIEFKFVCQWCLNRLVVLSMVLNHEPSDATCQLPKHWKQQMSIFLDQTYLLLQQKILKQKWKRTVNFLKYWFTHKKQASFFLHLSKIMWPPVFAVSFTVLTLCNMVVHVNAYMYISET